MVIGGLNKEKKGEKEMNKVDKAMRKSDNWMWKPPSRAAIGLILMKYRFF